MDYKQAGVDIDAAEEAKSRIKSLARTTFNPAVLSSIGSFGSLFSFDTKAYDEPLLVASTDGVGTKIQVARLANRHDTVGYDLVAHCVNDMSMAPHAVLPRYVALGAMDQYPSDSCRGSESSRVLVPPLRRGDRRDSGSSAGILRPRRVHRGRRQRRKASPVPRFERGSLVRSPRPAAHERYRGAHGLVERCGMRIEPPGEHRVRLVGALLAPTSPTLYSLAFSKGPGRGPGHSTAADSSATPEVLPRAWWFGSPRSGCLPSSKRSRRARRRGREMFLHVQHGCGMTRRGARHGRDVDVPSCARHTCHVIAPLSKPRGRSCEWRGRRPRQRPGFENPCFDRADLRTPRRQSWS